MEMNFTTNRRRSSAFSGVSCLTTDSGISVSSPSFSAASDLNSELFVSQANGNGYPIVQNNGCKKFGPPLNYEGEEPGAECELFIKDFPKDYLEYHLIPHFERFGDIYDFRLMMDYDYNNRGYAYVRFNKEESAVAALEVMKYYILPNGSTLQVQKSYNKCRLFVSNLPKDVPQEKIKAVFQNLFPKMTEMVIHVTEQNNRAFAFMDFPDHKAALEAKMRTSPGSLDLFDREVKIVWAFPERQVQLPTETAIKTLFIRNIGLSVNTANIKNFLSQAVSIKAIKSISPVRDFAFVDFVDHAAAEKVKEQLNGKIISKTPIEIEYARPPSDDSIHNLKQTDFDHKLRLKCIANYWETPIYLYGRVYEQFKIQNACVIIKSRTAVHYYFFEISYLDLVDIQARIAEVIVHLIDKYSQLPTECLVIKVEKDCFAVVGFLRNIQLSPTLIPSVRDPDVKIFFNEIFDLALMATIFGGVANHEIFMLYQSCISKPGSCEFIESMIVNGRIVGCVNPRVRHSSSSLPAGLPNHEMMFVLCCAYKYNNVNFFNKEPIRIPLQFFFRNGVIYQHHYIISPNLLPLRFVQSKRNNGPTCGHITFGKVAPQHQQQPLFQQWFYVQAPPPCLSPVPPAVYAPVMLSPTHSMYSNMPQRAPAALHRTNSNAF